VTAVNAALDEEANEVDVAEAAPREAVIQMKMVSSLMSLEWIGLYLAYKERDEVIANRDKDTSETRPRGRGRGGRGGGGGGRGREFDRHSATGRVYVLLQFTCD